MTVINLMQENNELQLFILFFCKNNRGTLTMLYMMM